MQIKTRLSPSESATMFPIGTIKKGNDDNFYIINITKTNIKRWFKYKSNTQKQDSSKKRSIKKSVKHSIKKNVKRSIKKSVKRSIKKNVKRSVKKSVKRSIKKNVKRSVKKSVKRSVKKSAKRSVKKSVKRSVKKSAKRSVKKSAKQSVKKSAKRSVKKSRKRSVKSVEQSINSEIKNKKYNPTTFVTMLAHKYEGQNIIGWYLSEKLDGYRSLFYNGPNGGKFISRNNKPFNAPDWFIKKISDNIPIGTLLDGELYTKRNDFEGMGVVRKKNPVDSEWEKITYQVFDLPLIKLPFEQRYTLLKNIVKDIPNIKVVHQHLIQSQDDFNNIHKDIISKKGEGSMLRQPGSFYEHKRSKTLLKVKDFFDDEVKIIGFELGEGRNKGRLGALHVKWIDTKMGTNEFKVGSGFDDKQRDNWEKLFPIGTIITIKYFEIDKNSKKARFPTFLRIKEQE